MTGFRADADPAVFRDAQIEGAYILDPWYPGCLEHLGPVRPARHVPGRPEMVRNFLQVEAARRGAIPSATGCTSRSSRRSVRTAS